MRMIRSALLALAGVALLTSCLLFHPVAGNVARWMVSPEPGTIYSFATTTTWQDGSEEESLADYVVERVEEQVDGSRVVKLVDSEDSRDFYWILDNESGAIYESNDPIVDEGDLLVITSPVREDTAWSYGTGEYEIQDIRLLAAAAFGRAHDAVEVDAAFDDLPGMDLTYEWSPDCGVFIYTEDYGSDSYLHRFRRELVAIAKP